MYEDKFTHRQTMNNPNFEFFHYKDIIPPVIDFHQHTFYEVFFFISGNVDYIIEGKTYHLRPGDLLITNNQDIHRPDIKAGKPYERYVLWLDYNFFNQVNIHDEDLLSCFEDAAQKDYRLIRPDDSHVITLKKIAELICREKSSSLFGSHILTMSYIMEFLVTLSRCYFDSLDASDNDVTENDITNRAIEYINENITSDLSLDEIAQKMFISKFYLSKQFKQFTGLSVYQYIIKKRLTISRNLIKNGIPVTTAYINSGFNDYSNYLKAFKREFGKNPSDFFPKYLR